MPFLTSCGPTHIREEGLEEYCQNSGGYCPAVQDRCVQPGLIMHEKIRRNARLFKAICVPG